MYINIHNFVCSSGVFKVSSRFTFVIPKVPPEKYNGSIRFLSRNPLKTKNSSRFQVKGKKKKRTRKRKKKKKKKELSSFINNGLSLE